MRVLFISMAAVPHVFPLVPLAWALRAAGHDVRVAGQPPAVATVTRAGLTAVPIAGDFNVRGDISAGPGAAEAGDDTSALSRDEALRRFMRLGPDAMETALVRLVDAMVGDLRTAVEDWRPDLVLADPLPFAAPLIAELTGAPFVRCLWGPALPPGRDRTAESDPATGRLPEALAALCERYGVPVREDYAVRTIDPCPPSMRVPDVPGRLPVRYVPYNGATELPDWLARAPKRQRVCVTWGTSTTRILGQESSPVPMVVDAVADLGAEIVVAVSSADRGQLAGVPDGVRILEDTPLSLLLPSCDAMIHTAGAGALMTATVNGVPQVTAPSHLGEQRLNAERLAAAGAGVNLSLDDFDAQAVRKATTEVLSNPGYREAAGALREEMLAQPTPAEVAGVLENLARQ
ncbi:nucleotide disphospho-sugar-binding domain-containing protein [Streptomyces diacarni]|uniref:nucleotide disphospho-sugar-binding domain-containing protein n=1 Tax=Streptomyces diacarni TaxID=2800381 RepID=UPI0033E233BC